LRCHSEEELADIKIRIIECLFKIENIKNQPSSKIPELMTQKEKIDYKKYQIQLKHNYKNIKGPIEIGGGSIYNNKCLLESNSDGGKTLLLLLLLLLLL
jgi:hypothetical protein